MIGGTDSRQEYRQSSVHLARKLVALLAPVLIGKNPDGGKSRFHSIDRSSDLVAGVGDLLPRVEHCLGGEQRSIGWLTRVTALLSW